MLLIWVLMCMPLLVYAGDIKTEITYPKEVLAVAAGHGVVALWVEDVRAHHALGRAVDGETLIPASDIGMSLYACMASALKAAGYQVVPYSSEFANGLMIHIRAITYTGSRAMIKSRVEVKVLLDAKMNNSDTTRTYQTSVEDQFALSPSQADNGKIIGDALAAAAAAVLADLVLSNPPEPAAAGQ